MAAAARPGPSEARVPCPVCGGLIHPIAGKCKHCKSDLRELRGPRPTAVVSLPALGGARPAVANPGAAAIVAAAAAKLDANGQKNGHSHAPATGGIPSGVVTDGTKPILPPRLTQQRYAASGTSASGERSAWRSWPVVVIVIAVIAIIAAIVLMVWPPTVDSGKRAGSVVPPAPDRMNTESLPAPKVAPAPAPDPHAPPPGDPWTKSGHIDVDPDPLDPQPSNPSPSANNQPLPDWNDLLRDPNLGMLNFQDPKVALFIGLAKHVCSRAAACGNSSMTICDAIEQMPDAPMPACKAVQKCIDHADHLTCGKADPYGITELFQMFPDCIDASRC